MGARENVIDGEGFVTAAKGGMRGENLGHQMTVGNTCMSNTQRVKTISCLRVYTSEGIQVAERFSS